MSRDDWVTAFEGYAVELDPRRLIFANAIAKSEFRRVPGMKRSLPNIIVAVHSDLHGGHDHIATAEWLELALRRGLAQVLPREAYGQASLLLTDDDTMRRLNREYRGLDQTTDVLSFSAAHGGHWAGDEEPPAAGDDWPADFPLPDGEPPPLGDIVISAPQAIRQAEAQGVPLVRELALLIVHGALHLLGHDHYDERERYEMQRLEKAALAQIFGYADPGEASA